MNTGDEVEITSNVGAYYSPDPEAWGPKFDLAIERGAEAEIIGSHPTLPGWWIARVFDDNGNRFAPVQDHHVQAVKA